MLKRLSLNSNATRLSLNLTTDCCHVFKVCLLSSRLKVRKDYSGVDGGIGVMEGSLKYDVYTVVMHRKIF